MQKKQTRGPRPLGDLIKEFVREQGLGVTGGRDRAFQAWTDAMGSESDKAKPVRFRNGELTVEVASTVHMHGLKSFQGEGYRRREYFKTHWWAGFYSNQFGSNSGAVTVWTSNAHLDDIRASYGVPMAR